MGKAGGTAAVPALVGMLKDSSIDIQQGAVRALYLTGSRSAVPVLISLLPSREWRVSLTAEYGLEVLTHRSGASTKLAKPPPDTYLKWDRWWKTDGQTAIIFKADQCGEIEPLPSKRSIPARSTPLKKGVAQAPFWTVHRIPVNY